MRRVHSAVRGELPHLWSVSGPAGPDRAVGAAHVAAGGLHLGAVGVGLLVDHLEIASELSDELLAARRPGATPEVTGGQDIPEDGPVLALQWAGLGPDQCAVGIHAAELVTDRHSFLLKDLCGSGFSWTGPAGRPAL